LDDKLFDLWIQSLSEDNNNFKRTKCLKIELPYFMNESNRANALSRLAHVLASIHPSKIQVLKMKMDLDTEESVSDLLVQSITRLTSLRILELKLNYDSSWSPSIRLMLEAIAKKMSWLEELSFPMKGSFEAWPDLSSLSSLKTLAINSSYTDSVLPETFEEIEKECKLWQSYGTFPSSLLRLYAKLFVLFFFPFDFSLLLC
jgi:hypothetical protein